ncbi:methylenetetrahydrofolate reductase C-terminal domain-containing protein, partial [Piscinibacter sp.]
MPRFGRWLAPVEHVAKGLFFDCQMCGDCALSVTGLACPMGCGKQMRNGPCGGVRANGHCELRPGQRCTWLEAGEGDLRMQGGARGEHRPSWRER